MGTPIGTATEATIKILLDRIEVLVVTLTKIRMENQQLKEKLWNETKTKNT